MIVSNDDDDDARQCSSNSSHVRLFRNRPGWLVGWDRRSAGCRILWLLTLRLPLPIVICKPSISCVYDVYGTQASRMMMGTGAVGSSAVGSRARRGYRVHMVPNVCSHHPVPVPGKHHLDTSVAVPECKEGGLSAAKGREHCVKSDVRRLEGREAAAAAA